MPDPRKEFGAKGEELAVKFLKREGYKILQRNYKCRLGEIDIIAEWKNILVFIEVKTRQTKDYGPPQSAITTAKKNQISRTALYYIKEKNLAGRSCRIDVIAITFSSESSKPKIEHIENAFYLSGKYTY